jgi:hypothetical protein
MALRGGGCFTPAAFLLVVGFLLILVRTMGESARPIRYGVGCLVGAVVFFGAAIYARWQGWG